MVWILVSEKDNQLTCRICPYVYYDVRTEYYTCKRTLRPVEACVWDKKRHDKCPIQATDTTPIPAVEVVHCKDCKHRFNYDICACRGDDWFCGYGERRTYNE